MVRYFTTVGPGGTCMQGAKYLYLSYGTNTLPNLLYLTLPYLIVLYDRTCRTASCVICYLLSYVIGETTDGHCPV